MCTVGCEVPGTTGTVKVTRSIWSRLAFPRNSGSLPSAPGAATAPPGPDKALIGLDDASAEPTTSSRIYESQFRPLDLATMATPVVAWPDRVEHD